MSTIYSVGYPLFFWQVRYSKLLEITSFQLDKKLYQLTKTHDLVDEK